MGGGGGAVRIDLEDVQTQRTVVVLGTHLGSGDSASDELKRLNDQVVPGLKSWLQEANQCCDNTVLCMDANSHPQLEANEEKESCWKVLRSAAGASVWDEYFDADGTPTKDDVELHPPVSSNKVRGPSSGQAKKIGLHSYYLIDHVYLNPAGLGCLKHVYTPHRFASESDALASVQPSLLNPSDHYPVVVDLAYRGHPPVVGVNARQNATAQAEALMEKLAAGELQNGKFTLLGAGEAASKAAEVAAELEARSFASTIGLQTSYERGSGILRVGMQRSS